MCLHRCFRIGIDRGCPEKRRSSLCELEPVGTQARQLVISFEHCQATETTDERDPSETAGSKKEARVTVNPARVIVLNRKIAHDLDVQNELPRKQRKCNGRCISPKVMAHIRCSPDTSSSKSEAGNRGRPEATATLS